MIKKYGLLFGVILTVATLGVVGWLMWEGTREIVVEIREDSLHIRSIYGTTINFDDILDIEILEQSMAAIGAGRRRAGHSTNNNWRGNFSEGLLLVQRPNEGPTIRINRRGDNPVFISKNDAAATRALYQEIADAI